MGNRKLSLGGDDTGRVAAPGYFDPETAKYNSPVSYNMYLNLGTGERHWHPRTLTMKRIWDGDTKGFKKVRSHHSIPTGWVWKQTKASLTPGQIKRRAALANRRAAKKDSE